MDADLIGPRTGRDSGYDWLLPDPDTQGGKRKPSLTATDGAP